MEASNQEPLAVADGESKVDAEPKNPLHTKEPSSMWCRSDDGLDCPSDALAGDSVLPPGEPSRAPLDIETGAAKMGTLEQSASPSKIRGIVVVKMLFCVLVWYTFSTCLTLYNKRLLGEHIGKFPTPMMMNSVHFSMQVVLSKAIVWCQSRGAKKGNRMSWRDYFVIGLEGLVWTSEAKPGLFLDV